VHRTESRTATGRSAGWRARGREQGVPAGRTNNEEVEALAALGHLAVLLVREVGDPDGHLPSRLENEVHASVRVSASEHRPAPRVATRIRAPITHRGGCCGASVASRVDCNCKRLKRSVWRARACVRVQTSQCRVACVCFSGRRGSPARRAARRLRQHALAVTPH